MGTLSLPYTIDFPAFYLKIYDHNADRRLKINCAEKNPSLKYILYRTISKKLQHRHTPCVSAIKFY